MNNRLKHRVSVKIALFHPTDNRVLMTVLPDERVGLPGGHIEDGETPDAAIKRELQEEIGLCEGDYTDIAQHSFWREPDGGRIILGYTGKLLREEAVRLVDPAEVEAVVWVSYDDLLQKSFYSATYNDFLLGAIQERDRQTHDKEML